MAEAESWAEGRILTSNDIEDLCRELNPTRNHSYHLGFKLGLPADVVKRIHSTVEDPEIRLREVVTEVLCRPSSLTWRSIADALRAPPLSLAPMANTIEAKFLCDSDETSMAVSQTSPVSEELLAQVECSALATSKHFHALIEVNKMIMILHEKFSELKTFVQKSLQEHQITVVDVADSLTSLSQDDDDDNHKIFMERHIEKLYTAVDIDMLFDVMNIHWNYLDPSLLCRLVKSFDLKEAKDQVESYASDLRQFRIKTPLTLFCQTQKRKKVEISSGFRQMIAEFPWPGNDDLTLEVVEQFRQEYASHYNLHVCAMMIAEVVHFD